MAWPERPVHTYTHSAKHGATHPAAQIVWNGHRCTFSQAQSVFVFVHGHYIHKQTGTNLYKPNTCTLGLSIMVMALLHSNGWCWQRKMFHVLQWASHSSLSSALLSRLACGLGRRLKPNVKYIYEREKTQWDYSSEKQLVFPTARLHIWCDSICGAVGGGWGTWREGFGRWWRQDYQTSRTEMDKVREDKKTEC